MATSTSARRRERPAFFDGQLLDAADLQDLEAYGSDLRWLHNRSLHQPGIGTGFAVSGEKGDREVVVGAGYAVDADGREIVLTMEVRLPVPAVAGESDGTSTFFDLTIAYANERDLKEAETRDGICEPRGAVRYLEAPDFCWVRLERDDSGGLSPKDKAIGLEMTQARRIRLARVEVLNCELRSPVALQQRREARPPRLPYIVAGVTDPEHDGDWIPLGTDKGKVHLPIQQPTDFLYAFTRVVNTCAAAFESAPWYTAHIVGPRLVGSASGGSQKGQFLIVDQVHVQEARRDRFTAFIVIAIIPLGEPDIPGIAIVAPPAAAAPSRAPCPDPADLDSTDKIVAWVQRCWQLSWMGVEQ